MKKAIMIDLETCDVSPNPAILSIGAVVIDMTNNVVTDSSFYETISLTSMSGFNFTIGASTIQWWMQQDDDARAVFNDEGRRHIKDALARFVVYVNQHFGNIDDVEIWGNGAAADNVWLKQAFENVGYDVPWKHWGDRCYRTVRAIYNEHYPDTPLPKNKATKHHALEDAKYQAHCLTIMRNRLGLWRVTE